MASRVAPGTFVLHSRAVPDLTAGAYVVHTEQEIAEPTAAPFTQGAAPYALDAHVEVTAPRFSLPPDQVLSTFPPNKSAGSFSSRLPQIVLRRRTLPWEREADPALAAGVPSGIPWLALVLLADGECTFASGRPIAYCVSPGAALPGRNDVAVGDAIIVTETVVRKVFPTKDELPLLAHVREVDLTDTELAMGDDDGWLAVVLSNRLPRPGVRYRACLISVEGQYGTLLDTAEIEPTPSAAFASPYVYANALDGLAHPGVAATARSTTIADAWSTAVVHVNDHRVRGREGWHVVGPGASIAGEIHSVDVHGIAPAERLFTFPVLAHWEFTCTDGADFEQLMRQLDVGMLGTVRIPPPGARGRKPAPARTRPLPQVVETGHIGLGRVRRGGDADTVWYRGPLIPHPGGREAPGLLGVLPLLHAADQARRVGPDGRDNLSLAAAFEIGRLLALSEAGVVAAFLNWRKSGFELARRSELVSGDELLGRGEVKGIAAGFAARLTGDLVADLGKSDAIRLGNPRPPIDGGCPINGLDNVDLVQLIATGFGVPTDAVRELIEPGATRTGAITVPVVRGPIDFGEISTKLDAELGHLRVGLVDTATTIAIGALAGAALGPPDALDTLLAQGKP